VKDNKGTILNVGLFTFIFCVSLVSFFSCKESSFDFGKIQKTEKTEDFELPTDFKVGLAGVKERGVLRVITRNNGNSYFLWRGRAMGFHYELVERFAKDLGVQLELIVPKDWDQMVQRLKRGHGDLIAASVSITPAREKHVLFAHPYMKTALRAVWKKGTQPIEKFSDLSEKSIHVRKGSSYYGALLKVNQKLKEEGLKPAKIVIEPESRETERILMDVASGKIGYTVCDYHIGLVNQTYLPELEMSPPSSKEFDLAWAVHSEATDLKEAIDAFFAKEKRGPIFNILFNRYYKAPHSHAKRKRDRLYSGKSGQISPYDDLIKSAASKYHFDWILLAAQIYQESRFDPNAKSWAGAQGLYQIMPKTAKSLGITDPKDPTQSINGGAKYLAKRYKNFEKVPDEKERLKMALAAYNCGLRHVQNARTIATERDELNPDRWEDVAKGLKLINTQEYRERPGFSYVRASEPIKYVKNIWLYHQSYKHGLGERDM